MVIGNGLVANRFKDSYLKDENIIIFASGVSNSKCSDINQFNREFLLLKETIQNNTQKIIVYFSTASVYDKDEKTSMYIRHKKEMENFLKTHCKSFYIFRVSNIIGETKNPYTFFNFFFNAIKNNTPFILWSKASRNIIDIDDVYKLIHHIIQKELLQNSIINIANTSNIPVVEIVKSIESFLNKKAIYQLIDKGNLYEIDVSDIKQVYIDLQITFTNEYLPLLLNKYYK